MTKSNDRALEDVLQTLEGVKKAGNEYKAICPAHEDSNPSLSIREENGKILVYCHAGCSQEAVLQAIDGNTGTGSSTRTTDESMVYSPVRPEDGARSPDFERMSPAPDFVWPYLSAEEQILGYICRFRQGLDDKTFKPYTRWVDSKGDTKWLLKTFPTPRPLYGLDHIAQYPDKPILVVEGEKTADAARNISVLQKFVVVTWPGGAKSTGKIDWSPLKQRQVVIWPDADEPGHKAADHIMKQLNDLGNKKVSIVNLPARLPKGWDLADTIPDGGDVGAIVDDATNRLKGIGRLLISAKDIIRLDIPPRDYIIEPFITSRSLNMLYAPRGVGKTWMSLQLALSTATGGDFFGYKVRKPVNVLYIDGEMPLVDIQKRLKTLMKGSPTERVRILPSERMFSFDSPLNIQTPYDRDRIIEMLQQEQDAERKVDLLIFDNLSSLSMGVDENDNNALDELLVWLIQLRHAGYAILLVHHTGKGGDQRGASRREDFMDTVISLKKPDRSEGEPPHSGAHFVLTFAKTRGEVPKPAELDIKLTTTGEQHALWSWRMPQKIDKSMEVLEFIYNEAPETQGAIAESMGLTPSRISQIIKTLRDKGYIEKSAKKPTITSQGREALARAFPRRFNTEDDGQKFADIF